MVTINLRDYYPHYGEDKYIEVTDEIAATLLESKRAETANRRRLFWNKAHYSLDFGDDIEKHALFLVLSPMAEYEQKAMLEQLHAAMAPCRKSRPAGCTRITSSHE